ncbi:MAG: hypothetical protein MUF10_10640 [Thermoanaerobaculaceae bacterium]|nr:hypothetical protein [Thermoanaerobaculaceae bacterium]
MGLAVLIVELCNPRHVNRRRALLRAADEPSVVFADEKLRTDNEMGVVAMSAVLQELLRAFQGLPEAEKHQLASAILRWEASADHPPVNDDELVAGAEAIFLALDRDEGSDV